MYFDAITKCVWAQFASKEFKIVYTIFTQKVGRVTDPELTSLFCLGSVLLFQMKVRHVR